MVRRVHRQISAELATLFQGSLKTVASGHKCGKTLPIKTDFCCLLGELFLKNENEFVTECSVFKKL
jgi:hypothetical protein